MPPGVGYGKPKKSKLKKAGLMRRVQGQVTDGSHQRALNAAFEIARRKKKR